MPQIITQREDFIDEQVLAEAKKLLDAGRLICFPTDTVYALAASCTHSEATKHIYQLKARDANKPLALLTASLEQAKTIAILDDRATRIAQHFLPGALTLIVPLRPDTPLNPAINAGLTTIGLRIPNHPFALALLRYYGAPMIATSVNLSGEESATSTAMIPATFLPHIDLIIDGGHSPIGLSSTVVDVTGDEVMILRQGTVQKEDIMRCIKDFS